MNWWWDSFVHHSICIIVLRVLENSPKDGFGWGKIIYCISLSKINNNNTKILGYIVDDRIYGYLYDKWTHKTLTLMKDC